MKIGVCITILLVTYSRTSSNSTTWSELLNHNLAFPTNTSSKNWNESVKNNQTSSNANTSKKLLGKCYW